MRRFGSGGGSNYSSGLVEMIGGEKRKQRRGSGRQGGSVSDSTTSLELDIVSPQESSSFRRFLHPPGDPVHTVSKFILFAVGFKPVLLIMKPLQFD
ncbi:hypothetical protein HPP92_002237 [Vanilla planifolia]|uniref:Uncharacterized protein n=1 Tax=Vanilla planifolia TaxID=51239 RepID=A0A835VIB4_VANPL|nr:hypothetical protein HPP92_002237 [Vanilla planifolia]